MFLLFTSRTLEAQGSAEHSVLHQITCPDKNTFVLQKIADRYSAIWHRFSEIPRHSQIFPDNLRYSQTFPDITYIPHKYTTPYKHIRPPAWLPCSNNLAPIVFKGRLGSMGSHPTEILEILEPADGDMGRILEQLLFNICGRTSYKPSIGLRRKCKKR